MCSASRTTPAAGATILDDARSLGPRIRSFSDDAESLRRLPAELVGLLAEGGFFKLGLPEEYGGAEVDPLTFIEVIDELARPRLRRRLVLDDRVDNRADGRGTFPPPTRRRSTAAIRSP